MKPYIKTYLDFFGYDESSEIPSEISGKPANQIHYIKARGMGGSKNRDDIMNLMALTFEEHIQFGDKKQHYDFLIETHKQRVVDRLHEIGKEFKDIF